MGGRHLPAWALAVAVVVTGGDGLRADTVKLARGLVYEQVSITGVGDGVITFRTRTGAEVRKPMSEVASLELSGRADFNQGEALLEQGRPAEALAALAQFERSGPTGWQKDLLRYRMLAAYEAAEQIDKAVELWLALCRESPSQAHVWLRPKKLAPAKSPANDRAMQMLTARLAGEPSKPLLREMRLLLVDLYERQGRLEEARALAAELVGGTTTVPAGSAPRGQAPEAPPPAANAQLRLAELSLKSGKFDEVVDLIQPRLKTFSASDLPTALCLLGQAQLELAKAAGQPAEGRDLLVQAGLNLMRVVANYADSDQAPVALLLAGQVNERLGNLPAARSAYSTILGRYGQSGSAGAAKAALEALDRKGKR